MSMLTDGSSVWETLLTTACGLIVALLKLDDSPENNSPEKPSADWRAAADRVYNALVYKAPPWYASLWREMRDRIRPPKLPPLQLTSKPLAVHELDIPPWYTSLFREIRDRIHPPKLPPLQLTSKPVAAVSELKIPPWYVSLWREIRDRIRPPKLPPLQVTSKPLEAEELWDEYRFGKRALPISLAIHGILVGLLVGIQIVAVLTTEVIFTPNEVSSHAVRLLPPPPPGPPAARPVSAPASVPRIPSLLQFPVIRRSEETAGFKAPPPLPGSNGGVPEGVLGGVPGGVVGGVPGGVVGGVIGEMLRQMAVPPPPLPEAPAKPPEPPPRRIQVSPEIQQAKLLEMIYPKYSPLAKRARIQGTVRIEAVITKEGTVSEVKVLAGHPLLVEGAIEAVSQWRYQPTLINGIPVEVVTFIDVNFLLAS